MKLTGISKAYQQERVLDEIALTIKSQSFTAFIGPNGAGKSTLLSIMSRLLQKDQGVLTIKGQEIEAWNSSELAKELAVLKQQQHYQAKLTVEELVNFGRFPYSKGRLTNEDRERVQQALSYLDIENLRNRYLNTLSGGQLQRVYIAMVLAQDTEFILLDEPLNNLDMKQSIKMMKTLRQLVDDLGKTVILVIHDINIAARYVDDMVAFKGGKVFFQGKTKEMMRKEILDPLYDMDMVLEEVAGKMMCIYQ